MGYLPEVGAAMILREKNRKAVKSRSLHKLPIGARISEKLKNIKRQKNHTEKTGIQENQDRKRTVSQKTVK